MENYPKPKIRDEKSVDYIPGDSEREFFDGEKELINPFSKYDNKYREFYRQQWMRNHSSWFVDGGEIPPMAKFFREIIASGKIKSPKDWSGLTLEEKRGINNRAFGPIDFNNSENWANSIRSGYEILGIGKDGFGGFLKDKFGRTDEEKKMAEEAIYDRRFKRYNFITTPMGRIPNTPEEEKQFEAMTSPEMNSTKAKSWMGLVDVEEDIRKSIMEAYDNSDDKENK